MTDWEIYIEFEGYPMTVNISLDDEEFADSDEVVDYVMRNIMIDAYKED